MTKDLSAERAQEERVTEIAAREEQDQAESRLAEEAEKKEVIAVEEKIVEVRPEVSESPAFVAQARKMEGVLTSHDFIMDESGRVADTNIAQKPYIFRDSEGRAADPKGEPINAARYARTDDGKVWKVDQPLSVAVRNEKSEFLFFKWISRKEFLIRDVKDVPRNAVLVNGDKRTDVNDIYAQGGNIEFRLQEALEASDTIISTDIHGNTAEYKLIKPYGVLYRTDDKGVVKEIKYSDRDISALPQEKVTYFTADPSGKDASSLKEITVSPVRGTYPTGAIDTRGNSYRFFGNVTGVKVDEKDGRILEVYRAGEELPEGTVTSTEGVIKAALKSVDMRIKALEEEVTFKAMDSVRKDYLDPIKASIGVSASIEEGDLNLGVGVEFILFGTDKKSFEAADKKVILEYLKKRMENKDFIKNLVYRIILHLNDFHNAEENEQRIEEELVVVEAYFSTVEKGYKEKTRDEAEFLKARNEVNKIRTKLLNAGQNKTKIRSEIEKLIGSQQGIEIAGFKNISFELVNSILEGRGIAPADFWRDYYGPIKRLEIGISNEKEAKQLAESKIGIKLGVRIGIFFPDIGFGIGPIIRVSKGPGVNEDLYRITRDMSRSDDIRNNSNKEYLMKGLLVLKDYCANMRSALKKIIPVLEKEVKRGEQALKEGNFYILASVHEELRQREKLLADINALYREADLKIKELEKEGYSAQRESGEDLNTKELGETFYAEEAGDSRNRQVSEGGLLYRAKQTEEYWRSSDRFADKMASEAVVFWNPWKKYKEEIKQFLQTRLESARYMHGQEKAELLEKIAAARLTYLLAKEETKNVAAEEKRIWDDKEKLRFSEEGDRVFSAEFRAANMRRIKAEMEEQVAILKLRELLGYKVPENAELGKIENITPEIIQGYLGSEFMNGRDPRLNLWTLEKQKEEYLLLKDLVQKMGTKKLGNILVSLGILDEKGYYTSRMTVGEGFEFINDKEKMDRYISSRIERIEKAIQKEKEDLASMGSYDKEQLVLAERAVETNRANVERSRRNYEKVSRTPMVRPEKVKESIVTLRQAESDLLESKKTLIAASILVSKTSKILVPSGQETQAGTVVPQERIRERAYTRADTGQLDTLDKIALDLRTNVPPRFTAFISPSVNISEETIDAVPGIRVVDPNVGKRTTVGAKPEEKSITATGIISAGVEWNLYNIYDTKFKDMAEITEQQKQILSDRQAMEDYQKLTVITSDIRSIEGKMDVLKNVLGTFRKSKDIEQIRIKAGISIREQDETYEHINNTVLGIKKLEYELKNKRYELEMFLGITPGEREVSKSRWIIGITDKAKGTTEFYGLSDITRYMGTSDGGADQISEFVSFIPGFVVNDIVSQDPAIQFLRKELVKDIISGDLARKERWNPGIDLSASSSIVGESGSFNSATLSAIINLWDFGKSKARGEVMKAREALTSLRLTKEQKDNVRYLEQLAGFIEAGYGRVKVSYERVISSMEFERDAQMRYEANTQDYNYWTYAKAIIDSRDARIDYLDAVNQYMKYVGAFKTRSGLLWRDVPATSVEPAAKPVTGTIKKTGGWISRLRDYLYKGKIEPKMVEVTPEPSQNAMDTNALDLMVRKNIPRVLKALNILTPDGTVTSQKYFTRNEWTALWTSYLSREDIHGKYILNNVSAEKYMERFIGLIENNDLMGRLDGKDIPDWFGSYFTPWPGMLMITRYNIDDEKSGIIPDIFARIGYVNFLVKFADYNERVGKQGDFIIPEATRADREHLKRGEPMPLTVRIDEDIAMMDRISGVRTDDAQDAVLWEKNVKDLFDRWETNTPGEITFADKDRMRSILADYYGRDIVISVSKGSDNALFQALYAYMVQHGLSFSDIERIFADIRPLKPLMDRIYNHIAPEDVAMYPEFSVLKRIDEMIAKGELSGRSDQVEQMKAMREDINKGLVRVSRLFKTLYVYNAIMEYTASKEIYIGKIKREMKGLMTEDEIIALIGYNYSEIKNIIHEMTGGNRAEAINRVIERYENPEVISTIKKELGVDLDRETSGFSVGDKIIKALTESIIETEWVISGSLGVSYQDKEGPKKAQREMGEEPISRLRETVRKSIQAKESDIFAGKGGLRETAQVEVAETVIKPGPQAAISGETDFVAKALNIFSEFWVKPLMAGDLKDFDLAHKSGWKAEGDKIEVTVSKDGLHVKPGLSGRDAASFAWLDLSDIEDLTDKDVVIEVEMKGSRGGVDAVHLQIAAKDMNWGYSDTAWELGELGSREKTIVVKPHHWKSHGDKIDKVRQLGLKFALGSSATRGFDEEIVIKSITIREGKIKGGIPAQKRELYAETPWRSKLAGKDKTQTGSSGYYDRYGVFGNAQGLPSMDRYVTPGINTLRVMPAFSGKSKDSGLHVTAAGSGIDKRAVSDAKKYLANIKKKGVDNLYITLLDFHAANSSDSDDVEFADALKDAGRRKGLVKALAGFVKTVETDARQKEVKICWDIMNEPVGAVALSPGERQVFVNEVIDEILSMGLKGVSVTAGTRNYNEFTDWLYLLDKYKSSILSGDIEIVMTTHIYEDVTNSYPSVGQFNVPDWARGKVKFVITELDPTVKTPDGKKREKTQKEMERDVQLLLDKGWHGALYWTDAQYPYSPKTHVNAVIKILKKVFGSEKIKEPVSRAVKSAVKSAGSAIIPGGDAVREVYKKSVSSGDTRRSTEPAKKPEDIKKKTGIDAGEKVLEPSKERRLEWKEAQKLIPGKLRKDVRINEVRGVKRFIRYEYGIEKGVSYVLLDKDRRQIAAYSQEHGSEHVYVTVGGSDRADSRYTGRLELSKENIPYVTGYMSEQYEYKVVKEKDVTLFLPGITEGVRFPKGSSLSIIRNFSKDNPEMPGEVISSYFYEPSKKRISMVEFPLFPFESGLRTMQQVQIKYHDDRGTVRRYLGKTESTDNGSVVRVRGVEETGRFSAPVMIEELNRTYNSDGSEDTVSTTKLDMFTQDITFEEMTKKDKDGGLDFSVTLAREETESHGYLMLLDRTSDKKRTKRTVFLARPGKKLSDYLSEKGNRSLDQFIRKLTKRGVKITEKETFLYNEIRDEFGRRTEEWARLNYSNLATGEHTIGDIGTVNVSKKYPRLRKYMIPKEVSEQGIDPHGRRYERNALVGERTLGKDIEKTTLRDLVKLYYKPGEVSDDGRPYFDGVTQDFEHVTDGKVKIGVGIDDNGNPVYAEKIEDKAVFYVQTVEKGYRDRNVREISRVDTYMDRTGKMLLKTVLTYDYDRINPDVKTSVVLETYYQAFDNERNQDIMTKEVKKYTREAAGYGNEKLIERSYFAYRKGNFIFLGSDKEIFTASRTYNPDTGVLKDRKGYKSVAITENPNGTLTYNERITYENGMVIEKVILKNSFGVTLTVKSSGMYKGKEFIPEQFNLEPVTSGKKMNTEGRIIAEIDKSLNRMIAYAGKERVEIKDLPEDAKWGHKLEWMPGIEQPVTDAYGVYDVNGKLWYQYIKEKVAGEENAYITRTVVYDQEKNLMIEVTYDQYGKKIFEHTSHLTRYRDPIKEDFYRISEEKNYMTRYVTRYWYDETRYAVDKDTGELPVKSEIKHLIQTRNRDGSITYEEGEISDAAVFMYDYGIEERSIVDVTGVEPRIRDMKDTKALLKILAESGERFIVYRTFNPKEREFETEQWEAPFGIKDGQIFINWAEGTMKLIRQGNHRLPEGWFLTVPLEGGPGNYSAEKVFLGKKGYERYGLSNRRVTEFYEMPSGMVTINADSGMISDVDKDIIGEFVATKDKDYSAYKSAFLYDALDGSQKIIIPGMGEEGYEQGMFYFQKKIKIGHKDAGVVVGKLRLKMKDGENIARAWKRLRGYVISGTVQLDFGKHPLGDIGELESLFYTGRIGESGDQVYLFNVSVENGKIREDIYANLFTPEGVDTTKGWKFKYDPERRLKGSAELKQSDEAKLIFNQIDVLKPLLPKEFEKDIITLPGKEIMHWSKKALTAADEEYNMALPDGRIITFTEKDEGIVIVSLFNEDGTPYINPYVLEVGSNAAAKELVKGALRILDQKRKMTGLKADMMFNENVGTDILNTIYTMARFNGINSSAKLAKVLGNASVIRKSLSGFIAGKEITPSVVSGIVYWTVKLTLVKDEDTGEIPLTSNEEFAEFSKNLKISENIGIAAVKNILGIKNPKLIDHFNLTNEDKSELMGVLIYWASHKKEGFNFGEFYAKFMEITAYNEEIQEYLRAFNKDYDSLSDEKKIKIYIERVAFFAQHMLRNGYSTEEIRHVIKGQAEILKGATYSDAESMVVSGIRWDKFVGFLKMAGAALAAAATFFGGLGYWVFKKFNKKLLSPKTLVRKDVFPKEADEKTVKETADIKSKDQVPKASNEKGKSIDLALSNSIQEKIKDIEKAEWEASRKISPQRYKLVVKITLSAMRKGLGDDALILMLNDINEENQDLKNIVGEGEISPGNLEDILEKIEKKYGTDITGLITLGGEESLEDISVSRAIKSSKNSFYKEMLKRVSTKEIVLGQVIGGTRYAPKSYPVSSRDLRNPSKPVTEFSKLAWLTGMVLGGLALISALSSPIYATPGVFIASTALILMGIYSMREYIFETFLNFRSIRKAKRGVSDKTQGEVIDELIGSIEKIKGDLKKTEEDNKDFAPGQWAEIMKMPVAAPFAEPKLFQPKDVIEIDMYEYMDYCIDWLRKIKSDPKGFVFYARGHFPWNDPQFYSPTLYVQGRNFVQAQDQKGFIGLVPGDADTNGNIDIDGTENTYKKAPEDIDGKRTYNGPDEWGASIQAIPSNNISKYIGALQYRVRRIQEKVYEGKTVEEAIVWETKERRYRASKMSWFQQGFGGPDVTRSSYWHGIKRHSANIKQVLIISGVLLAITFGVRDYLQVQGIIPAIRDMTGWFFSFVTIFAAVSAYMVNIMVEKVLLFIARFRGNPASITPMDAEKSVPRHILIEILNDITKNTSQEDLPEYMKVDISEENISRIIHEMEKDTKDIAGWWRQRNLKRRGITPSKWPSYSMFLNYPVLEMVFLEKNVKRDKLIEIISSDERLNDKVKMETLKMRQDRFSNKDILERLDLEDIKYLCSSENGKKLFPRVALMETTFHAGAGEKLVGIVESAINTYPGGIDVFPVTDDTDRPGINNMNVAIYGNEEGEDRGMPAHDPKRPWAGELYIHKERIRVVAGPQHGINLGKHQQKIRMKPPLNAEETVVMNLFYAVTGKKKPETVDLNTAENEKIIKEEIGKFYEKMGEDAPYFVELVDEEDRLQPLLLRMKLCVWESRENTIRRQLDAKDADGVITAEEEKNMHSEGERWGISLDDSGEQIIKEYRDAVKNLSKQAGESPEKIKNASEEEAEKWIAEGSDGAARAKYMLWAFLQVYPDEDTFLASEFRIRNIPTVMQTELRLVPIKKSTDWSHRSWLDYLVWHNSIQIGQTKSGFLFLGGTGNGFLWEMLSGIRLVKNETTGEMEEMPLHARVHLGQLMRPLRERIAQDEADQYHRTEKLGFIEKRIERAKLLREPNEAITVPSELFRKYLNVYRQSGVWDSYNQIEDAELGSRLALYKLMATRLEGKYVQVLEDELPPIGFRWWLQRSRWITMQTFWAIISYKPMFFMFFGQYIGAGLGWMLIGSKLNIAAGLLIGAPIGFFAGGLFFYAAGYTLFRIMTRMGTEPNEQWHISPMDGMGDRSFRGWIRGWVMFQHMVHLSSSTLAALATLVTIIVTNLYVVARIAYTFFPLYKLGGAGLLIRDYALSVEFIIKEMIGWLPTTMSGIAVFFYPPFILTAMSMIIVWIYASKDDESTSEAFRVRVMKRGFTIMEGLEYLMNTQHIDPETGKEMTVIPKLEKDDFKSDEKILYVLNKYKQFLKGDGEVVDLEQDETGKVVSAKLIESGTDVTEFYNIFENAVKKNIDKKDNIDIAMVLALEEIMLEVEQIEKEIKGEVEIDWKAGAIGFITISLAAVFWAGTIFPLWGILSLLAFGSVLAGSWSVDVLYRRVFKKPLFVVGRLPYHTLKYGLKAPTMLIYYTHMIVSAYFNAGRNLFPGYVSEGYWTRGRQDAIKKALGKKFTEQEKKEKLVDWIYNKAVVAVLFFGVTWVGMLTLPVIDQTQNYNTQMMRSYVAGPAVSTYVTDGKAPKSSVPDMLRSVVKNVRSDGWILGMLDNFHELKFRKKNNEAERIKYVLNTAKEMYHNLLLEKFGEKEGEKRWKVFENIYKGRDSRNKAFFEFKANGTYNIENWTSLSSASVLDGSRSMPGSIKNTDKGWKIDSAILGKDALPGTTLLNMNEVFGWRLDDNPEVMNGKEFVIRVNVPRTLTVRPVMQSYDGSTNYYAAQSGRKIVITPGVTTIRVRLGKEGETGYDTHRSFDPGNVRSVGLQFEGNTDGVTVESITLESAADGVGFEIKKDKKEKDEEEEQPNIVRGFITMTPKDFSTKALIEEITENFGDIEAGIAEGNTDDAKRDIAFNEEALVELGNRLTRDPGGSQEDGLNKYSLEKLNTQHGSLVAALNAAGMLIAGLLVTRKRGGSEQSEQPALMGRRDFISIMIAGITAFFALIIINILPDRFVPRSVKDMAQAQDLGNAINIEPEYFKVQENEILIDLRGGAINGRKYPNGIDLTDYVLEVRYPGRYDQMQLFFKNNTWKNVYSYPMTVNNEKIIEFDPLSDGRNVDQFNNFRNIYAVGVKIRGTTSRDFMKKVISIRLVRRSGSPVRGKIIRKISPELKVRASFVITLLAAALAYLIGIPDIIWAYSNTAGSPQLGGININDIGFAIGMGATAVLPIGISSIIIAALSGYLMISNISSIKNVLWRLKKLVMPKEKIVQELTPSEAGARRLVEKQARV
ncbi:MAG: TolC family protein, partial [Candidatus Omnitrophota bacterium]